MTNRNRALHIHGISKNTYNDPFPLPEKADEPSLPYNIDEEVYLHLSPEESEAFTSSTGQSSPNTGRFSNAFFSESISSSFGTGITGRSSVYSWGIDDEFDEKAASQVCSMFREIDGCLFENDEEPEYLKGECIDWKTTYPYIRVVGQQLLPSKDTGTEMVEASMHASSAPFSQEIVEVDYRVPTRGSSENMDLNINGYKVDATKAPTDGEDFLEEEIFAQDGDIEEFIAFDNNNIEYCESIRRNGRRNIMPPMSPHAFVRETALSECFDHVWSEIVSITKDLLVLFIEARAKREFDRVQESFDQHIDRLLESSIELPQTRDSYSRLQGIQSQFKLKPGMFATSSNHNGLQELITIRSLPLQQRAPSVTPSLIQLSSDDIPSKEFISNSRPVSSVNRQYPPRVNIFHNTEQQIYDRMMSAKTPKRGLRLQPLQPPKTAGQIENLNVGEVRGTKMQTSLTALNQFWGPRSGALPPLERISTAETALLNRDNRSAKTKRNSRASSAVSIETKNQHIRDRTSFVALPDSRPYTTNFSLRGEIQNLSKNMLISQTKSRDNLLTNQGRSFHAHSSNALPEGLYTFPSQMKNLSISRVGEEDEVDDFILLGHGPPLLAPNQRKNKIVGSNIR